jgi:hypothetical protein
VVQFRLPWQAANLPICCLAWAAFGAAGLDRQPSLAGDVGASGLGASLAGPLQQPLNLHWTAAAAQGTTVAAPAVARSGVHHTWRRGQQPDGAAPAASNDDSVICIDDSDVDDRGSGQLQLLHCMQPQPGAGAATRARTAGGGSDGEAHTRPGLADPAWAPEAQQAQGGDVGSPFSSLPADDGGCNEGMAPGDAKDLGAEEQPWGAPSRGAAVAGAGEGPAGAAGRCSADGDELDGQQRSDHSQLAIGSSCSDAVPGNQASGELADISNGGYQRQHAAALKLGTVLAPPQHWA